MNSKSNNIVVLILIGLLMTGTLYSQGGNAVLNQSQAENESENVAVRVKKAFQIARTSGDFGPSSALQHLGAAIIPFLTPYLEDSNEDIRRQVVALLKVVGHEAALSLLVKALADPVLDIQQRATLALYTRYEPTIISSQVPSVGTALQRSIKAGNHSVAALLLLSYFPSDDSKKVLRTMRDRVPSAQTELFPWSPVVPVSLPARVALSRLGDQESQLAVLEQIELAKLNELEFLLTVIREIDTPKILQALAKTLDDTREVNSGVPSGVTPRRRLCDVAVNAFIQRLQLKVNFELSEAIRYSRIQLDEVRDKVSLSISDN